MLCDAAETHRAAEVMERFRAASTAAHLPIAGALDLTYRCDFRCVHCYAGHLNGQTAEEAGELPAAAVIGLLEQAADAGCLSLLISGGEPLLRPDFPAIYRAARELGMVVTVFTNGTLVTPAHVELFRDCPPHRVEVTLYGASREVFDRVTGVPGSFDRAWHGIDLLRGGGVRLGLKAMILRENEDEIPALDELAREMDVPFRLDPLLSPRLNGDPAPLAHRVAAARAAALQAASPKYRAETGELIARQRDSGASSRVFRCGAGVTGFHLDPRGVLRPCLASRSLAFDAAAVGFAAAWAEAVRAVAAVEAPGGHPCSVCDLASVCGYCPGLFELETGSMTGVPDYVCELGRDRAGAAQQ